MKAIKKSHIYWMMAFFVGAIVLNYVGTSRAGNETGTIANNITSMLGVTRISTKNATGLGEDPQFETRRIRTANNGVLLSYFAVSKASFVTVAATTNTDPTDGVGPSTFTVANSTSLLPNPNVFAVGSTSEPVLLKGFIAGTNNGVRVRIWDSRGATETVKGAIPIYDKVLWSTAGYISEPNINQWCSSGVTVMVGAAAVTGGPNVNVQWAITKQE